MNGPPTIMNWTTTLSGDTHRASINFYNQHHNHMPLLSPYHTTIASTFCTRHKVQTSTTTNFYHSISAPNSSKTISSNIIWSPILSPTNTCTNQHPHHHSLLITNNEQSSTILHHHQHYYQPPPPTILWNFNSPEQKNFQIC